MESFLVENDQDNIYINAYKININMELLFFNLQWYFILPHMLVTRTGKSPLKKTTKKPHASFTFYKNSDEKPGIYFIWP